MCGIAGLLDKNLRPDQARRLGRAKLDTIRHRGPDSHSVWLGDSSSLLLGHAQLAIQDLSSRGHQSMHSVSGRYCLVFNGKI